jgi:hypothetical protein
MPHFWSDRYGKMLRGRGYPRMQENWFTVYDRRTNNIALWNSDEANIMKSNVRPALKVL